MLLFDALFTRSTYGFERWSDVGNIFVYIICIFCLISFLEIASSSEKDIPWSGDGINCNANRSTLSLGYELNHTCFGLVCNTIRYEGLL